MISFGERIVRTIVEAETKRAGYCPFFRLDERLEVYFADADDRRRFLEDASKISRKKEEYLSDAFFLLLPIDCQIICWQKGIRLGRQARSAFRSDLKR